MNHSELATFLEVARKGSFSRAAQTLAITQPAVSKRVQSLEALLNSRLFDRLGRRAQLTDAGRLLLPKAEAIVTAMADTQRVMTNLSEQIAGELRIATSHHVGLHRLAPVLRRFNRSFDQVALDIRFEDSETAHELVRSATVELAIVTLNPAGDDTLVSQPLWDDPLVFVVAEDHCLATAPSLSLPDLANAPCIMPGSGTYTGRIVMALFAEAKLTLQPPMSTNYLETIGMLVTSGLGWSVLPRSMLTRALHELALPGIELHRQLGVVTHPQRTLSNAARALMGVTQQFADD